VGIAFYPGNVGHRDNKKEVKEQGSRWPLVMAFYKKSSQPSQVHVGYKYKECYRWLILVVAGPDGIVDSSLHCSLSNLSWNPTHSSCSTLSL
jgi:hypothetical protein